MTTCGFIAVLGAANAGKSTLVNTLTGEKVSIVSSKPHTTRNRIYGITCIGPHQLIFVDTPGLIMRPEGMLQQYMKKAVWRTSREADIGLVVIDAAFPQHALTERLLTELLRKEKTVFLCFNKIDRIAKETLLPLAHRYQAFEGISRFFMISGLKNQGLDDLKEALMSALPEGPWLFEPDALTQISQRLMAAEITREKIFHCLHQEIPYKTHVATDLWYIPGHTEPPPNMSLPSTGITLFQTIFVEKETHRKLVLGHGGQRIKHIGTLSRHELQQRLQQPIHLFLHVKVAPDWAENPEVYRTLED